MIRCMTSRMYRKFLAAFLAVALIPLCTVYIYINSRYLEQMKADAVRVNRMAQEQIGMQLETFFNRMEYISNLFYNQATQKILSGSEDTLSLYNARMELEKLVRVNLDMYQVMDQVERITFRKTNGTLLDITNSGQWYIPFSNIGLLPVNTYKHQRIYSSSMVPAIPGEKLVYVRTINDVENLNQEIGSLYILFDKTQLDQIFYSLEQVIQTKVQITDGEGNEIYANFEGQTPDGAEWVIWSYPIQNLNLTVTFFDETSKISANITTLDSLTGMVILLSIASIFLISFLLSKTMVTPVIRLRDNLRNAQKGNFKVRVPIESNDELGEMGQAFNDMAEEIDRLVNQVYSTQIKEKEAAIAALQTQINPHFLYNTLDMIKSMADIHEAYELGDVIVALSKLFRYATHTSNVMVTVREEIDNLQNYMKIISTRFGGRIHFQVHVPEELMGQQMIKVFLQPLAENAVSHGMSRGRRVCNVSVTIKTEDEDILVLVEDDGAGIPKERLEEIRKELAQPVSERRDSEKIGVGLKNIHDRIRLYYGDRYGVTLESKEQIGTRVSVRYPLRAYIRVLGMEENSK